MDKDQAEYNNRVAPGLIKRGKDCVGKSRNGMGYVGCGKVGYLSTYRIFVWKELSRYETKPTHSSGVYERAGLGCAMCG